LRRKILVHLVGCVEYTAATSGTSKTYQVWFPTPKPHSARIYHPQMVRDDTWPGKELISLLGNAVFRLARCLAAVRSGSEDLGLIDGLRKGSCKNAHNQIDSIIQTRNEQTPNQVCGFRFPGIRKVPAIADVTWHNVTFTANILEGPGRSNSRSDTTQLGNNASPVR
jgi:hypothetical protein